MLSNIKTKGQGPRLSWYNFNLNIEIFWFVAITKVCSVAHPNLPDGHLCSLVHWQVYNSKLCTAAICCERIIWHPGHGLLPVSLTGRSRPGCAASESDSDSGRVTLAAGVRRRLVGSGGRATVAPEPQACPGLRGRRAPGSGCELDVRVQESTTLEKFRFEMLSNGSVLELMVSAVVHRLARLSLLRTRTRRHADRAGPRAASRFPSRTGAEIFENVRWPSRRARSDSGGRQSRWTQCRSPLAALPAPAEPVPESKQQSRPEPDGVVRWMMKILMLCSIAP